MRPALPALTTALAAAPPAPHPTPASRRGLPRDEAQADPSPSKTTLPGQPAGPSVFHPQGLPHGTEPSPDVLNTAGHWSLAWVSVGSRSGTDPAARAKLWPRHCLPSTAPSAESGSASGTVRASRGHPSRLLFPCSHFPPIFPRQNEVPRHLLYIPLAWYCFLLCLGLYGFPFCMYQSH